MKTGRYPWGHEKAESKFVEKDVNLDAYFNAREELKSIEMELPINEQSKLAHAMLVYDGVIFAAYKDLDAANKEIRRKEKILSKIGKTFMGKYLVRKVLDEIE